MSQIDDDQELGLRLRMQLRERGVIAGKAGVIEQNALNGKPLDARTCGGLLLQKTLRSQGSSDV